MKPSVSFEPLRREVLLPEAALMPGAEIIADGLKRGRQIRPARCPFLDHYGVDSEAAYKRQRVAAGEPMFHAQIGYRDLEKTVRACAEVYESLSRRGYRVDRYGITFDRNMGYPAALRSARPKGTGLILDSFEGWQRVTSAAPVASHYGDFMIGLPAAIENTAAALEVGATTIGNLAHFYNYRLLYEDDEVERAVSTLTAMAMVAGQPNEVMISSNVDDGFGSLFVDIACALGLVLVEQYLVQDLVGARHVSVFGNTFGNPHNRMVFQRALTKITGNMGPMVYGATTLYTADKLANHASLGNYLMFDLAAQALSPSGHAVTAVPITEYERIPEVDEIVEAQTVANRLSELAANTLPLINQEAIEAQADRLIDGALEFKRNLFEGLTQAGVDTRDALELLLCIRRIGARDLERRFGPGEEDAHEINRRRSVLVSENMARLRELGDATLAKLSNQQRRALRDRGLRACVATTDVHEYGKIVIEQVLQSLAVDIQDAGNSADPASVARNALSSQADFIALSTYNGIALTYLKALRAETEALGLAIPIFVGGRVNQIPDHSNTSLPVDVSCDVSALGVTVCTDVDEMLRILAS